MYAGTKPGKSKAFGDALRRARPGGCCCRSRRSGCPCAWNSSIACTCTAQRLRRGIASARRAAPDRACAARQRSTRPAERQVAVDEVVRGGLVGDEVGPDAAGLRALTSSGRTSAALPSRPIDTACSRACSARDPRERLVEVAAPARRGSACAGACRCATAGTRWRATTAPASVAASGCAPPMPPRPAVRIQRPGEIAAVVLAAGLDEGLVGALHDALGADVDPRAGGHLAVHHQALAVELVEVLPRRPLRHEVRVGDQHARRIGVRAEHADRLARLDQQRLVVVRARCSAARIASKHSQLRAALPMPP